ncbi:hypothetical protein AVEN_53340-1 [Araneus ventricosus]|uniref:Uncharacterized protein n=1 Tax=Araneus ventricosus TaxID=182803 RepID=A0A4Y2ABH7_ARAVE|nr:hypothetical protein AVEN_53340-1 [Araneus ventricosus]
MPRRVAALLCVRGGPYTILGRFTSFSGSSVYLDARRYGTFVKKITQWCYGLQRKHNIPKSKMRRHLLELNKHYEFGKPKGLTEEYLKTEKFTQRIVIQGVFVSFDTKVTT